jgi:hypothetical protein
MDEKEMFNRLVENGFDFLSKSVSEIKDSPKYSIIHFYAAVELFLKARLLKEHWTLAISKKCDPDWSKFIGGDFQSVTLDEAALKLDKIVKSGLSKPIHASFRLIGNHRNKMVHFFHDSQSASENEITTRAVVKQLLNAWYYLHYLIAVQWKDIFFDWNKRLITIDLVLKEMHDFLQIVYDNLKDIIVEKKKIGVHFEKCPSCGFEAKEIKQTLNTIFKSSCLVCDLEDDLLLTTCPACANKVLFRDEGFGTCSNCGKAFEPSNLAEMLLDNTSAFLAAKDEGDYGWGIANCGNCEGYHTVVFTENEEWFCASCFATFKEISTCEWCNEKNTGNMKHSYMNGCNCCDGLRGENDD